MRVLAGALLAASLSLVGCGADGGGPAPTSVPSTAPAPTATAVVPDLHPSVDDWPAGVVVVDPGDGAAPLQVAVRIADTRERRAHGLMEVPVLPDGVGMWFAYDRDTDGGYWMENTLVDLDIAWVAADGTIVATDTMSTCEPGSCPSHRPGADYRAALEVPAGWLAEHGVEVGDRARLVSRD